MTPRGVPVILQVAQASAGDDGGGGQGRLRAWLRLRLLLLLAQGVIITLVQVAVDLAGRHQAVAVGFDLNASVFGHLIPHPHGGACGERMLRVKLRVGQ